MDPDTLVGNPAVWGAAGVLAGALVTNLTTFLKTRVELAYQERKSQQGEIKSVFLDGAIKSLLGWTIDIETAASSKILGSEQLTLLVAPVLEAERLDARFGTSLAPEVRQLSVALIEIGRRRGEFDEALLTRIRQVRFVALSYESRIREYPLAGSLRRRVWRFQTSRHARKRLSVEVGS